MSKIQEKAQKYFEQNIGRKEVFATSDGFLFVAKQHAIIHGNTLKDKEVQTLTKSGKVADITVEAEEVKPLPKNTKTGKKRIEPKNPANTGSDQVTKK